MRVVLRFLSARLPATILMIALLAAPTLGLAVGLWQGASSAQVPSGDASLRFNPALSVPGARADRQSKSVRPASNSLVISQVYGGGGNSGAPLQSDFIELFNPTSAPITMTNWSVQYASSAGSSWSRTIISGTIPPGGYFLIQEASGSSCLPSCQPLPFPDAVGSINMSSTSGKVALVSGSDLLSGSCPSGSPVVDFVGYGSSANCYEGSGPTGTLSNTTSAARNGGGCVDTDNNNSDFTVTSSIVPRNSSYPQNPCGSTQTSTPTLTAGPTDTPGGPTATATPVPPTPTSTATATATPTPVRIHEIQQARHFSTFNGQRVYNVPGIVTVRRTNGFYMQDPSPDADEATSEGIFVFTSSAPSVNVGDSVLVTGTVSEFRPGGSGGTTNLTITELTSPTITVVSTGNPTPTPVIIGSGGRVPPDTVIEDDATGDVETSGIFDPAQDGIDFYESLESMLVQVNNAVAVGPTNNFGEIPVLADDGAGGGVRTNRGGIIIQPTDFNPERIILDDVITNTPSVNVGDHFSAPVVGVMDYSFGNFKLLITQQLTPVPTTLPQETTTPQGANQIAIGTFNVENLDPTDPQSKFDALASIIVNNMKSPDIISIEEVQDNDGPANTNVVDADVTWGMLISAIQSAGGPAYDYRQINPVDDQDGGEPGGNIRVGFLFRTDRGVSFIDRPGGCPTCPTTVLNGSGGPYLSYSPGRIDPNNSAFNNSRKPLAGEFTYNGHRLFLIGNHFNSKSGDDPLFGRFQPPNRSSEVQRNQQAQVVNNFVSQILSYDPNANVVVLGDLNDFYFSSALITLKGTILHDMIETLPLPERYTYVFDGNSQDLDHTLVSDHLMNTAGPQVDVVHVDAEYAPSLRPTDHDPEVTRLTLAPVQTATPTSTDTPTSTATAVPTDTPTYTATPTDTPAPTSTSTATSTATSTYTSTPTNTGTPTSTRTPTNTPTNTPTRTNTPTPTATATPDPCGYQYSAGTGTIEPGTFDIGNHTDDGVTFVTLPFTYNFYGQAFTSVNVSSNGNLQFTSSSTNFSNVCLPATTFNNAILPYWDDLRTDGTGGIYTSVTGVAPNRIFNIEWRACIRTGSTACTSNDTNFEVRLYEGQSRFDLVYGSMSQNGSGATVGVQKGTGTSFTQYSCNTASLSNGLLLVFTLPPCGEFTPTSTPTVTGTPPTNTPTRTPTNTPTNTPTPTPTVCGVYYSEIEPNNTITQTQPLPTTSQLQLQGAISPAGDLDYYSFSATQGTRQWAYVFTGSSSSGTDSQLTLIDPISNTVQFDDDNGSQGSLSSAIAGAPISTTGVYTYKVNYYNNTSTITPYIFYLDTTSGPATPEVEPNDTYTQANSIAIGSVITGTISSTTDNDYYAITVGANDKLVIQVDGDPERDGVQTDPIFQIISTDGTTVLATVDSSSTLCSTGCPGSQYVYQSENYVYTFATAGTYYIREYADGSSVGTYNLHVWRPYIVPCGTATPTATSTATATGTPPTPTNTPTSTVTATATNTFTSTPTRTPTNTPTSTPTPTATACVQTALFSEDFESGTLGQFVSSVATGSPTPNATPGWRAVTDSVHTGTYSAFAPDPAGISDQLLTTSSPIAVPSGYQAVVLSFWHNFTMETNYDGGVLEFSTDGGATFTDVLSSTTFIFGGYNGTISTCCSNPLAGRQAWTGTSSGWREVQVNLSPFAGQSILFRLREGTDSSVAGTGWWVDDVRVYAANFACPTNTPVPTATGTPTSTATATVTPTETATYTATPVPTSTPTGTATATGTPTSTATPTAVPTSTAAPTFTPTYTPTFTPTYTPTYTNTPVPTNTVTPTATPTATVCIGVSNYTITTATATIVPGTTDIGNHCDDCTTSITFPFPVTFYGVQYTTANVSSNGNIQFNTNSGYLGSGCPMPSSILQAAILGYQDDLMTSASGNGIFSATLGTAPNRTFVLEWRHSYFGRSGTGNFEILFFENNPSLISVVYGSNIDNGSSEGAGVQASSTGPAAQFSCLTASLTPGLRVNYTYQPCLTPTPTVTGTPTPTNTPTGTATSTPTRTFTPTFTATSTPTSTATPTRTNTPAPSPTPTQCLPNGPWTPWPPYPQTIARYAFVNAGTYYYVISGVSNGSVVNTFRRWTVGGSTWDNMPNIPVGSEAPSAVYYNNKIYVVPGYGQSAFQIFDLSTNTWSNGPAYPGQGYGEAAGVWNGMIHVVGGGPNPSTQHWVFNISANTWSAGSPAPYAYLLGGYQQVGQYLYMIGSYGSSPLGADGRPMSSLLNPIDRLRVNAPTANSTVSMRLDLSSGTFSTGPTWTQARADFGLAYDSFRNKLYAIGGDASGSTYFDSTDLVDELDLTAWPGGAWVSSPPNLPSARQANQGGFTSYAAIATVGGLRGPSPFTWLDEHLLRSASNCPSPTSTPIRTNTPTPTNTPTSTPTRTSTPVPTSTLTSTATATATAIPSNTPTRTNTPTATSTAVPPSPTNTSVALSPTRTAVPPSPTNTAVPPAATNTPSAPSPTPTELVCEMNFSDVPPNYVFYPFIRCLYCRGIIGGYNDPVNCAGVGTPCFRPENPTTRGQMSKIVANAAGILDPIPPGTQTYTDVPPSHPFWVYIERLSAHGIVGGYNDPVNCPMGVPCFRPDNWVTRGQLTKFASNAAGFSEPIPSNQQTYTDVPPTQTFYVYIERLSSRGIISGYQCGQPPAGPCDPQNRPWFLPDATITRGQTSKIVSNTFFPVNCAPRGR